MALGSLCSFAFSIASSMILSRYFDKTDYGTYKQVLYVYNSLLTVFTLGLPKAFSYFLPKSPLNEAKSLIRKITNLFFLLGLVLSLLLFLSSGIIADFLNNPDLKSALRVFSPVPFLMLPTMGLEGILSTYRKTKFLAGYTIFTRVIMLLCVAVPVVIFDLNCNEALIGFGIGSLLSCLLALWLKYYPVRREKSECTTTTYGEIFKFSLPLLFASIWGILINSTDQFFISRYFGAETFAEFSNGAMELPFVGMIIGACSTVLTPLFTKQVHEKADFKKTIYPVWISAFEKSAMLIYPITIFCFFDATLIMQVMYGDMYAASGDYFRIKLLTYFVKVISYYSILVALGATKFYSNVFMILFFILLPFEYVGVKLCHNPLIITAIHVVFSIVHCFIYLYYVAKKVSTSLLSLFPLRTIGKIFVVSLISLLIVFLLRNILWNNVVNLLILLFDVATFAVCFAVLSLVFKLKYYNMVKAILIK